MSNAALNWAIEQELPSSQKLVLIILANRANPAEECFPSVSSLSQDTGLNRKIVIKCLDRLQQAGLIEETGRRQGKTHQIKIYRLLRKSPRSGTVPHPEQFHISPETVPHVEHGTQRNPKGTLERGKSMNADDPEIELPPHFPKTEAAAVVHAAFAGCTEEFARTTWNQAMARGGRDSRDCVIRSWRHHLKAAATYQEERDFRARSGPNGTPKPVDEPLLIKEAKRELEALRRQFPEP